MSLVLQWYDVSTVPGCATPPHSAGDSALLPGLSPWHGMNSWTNSDKNNDMTSKRVLNDPDFWVRYTDILLYFRKWFWRSTWQGAWTSYDVLRTSNGHPRIFISGFDPSWDIVAKPPALRGVAEIRGGADSNRESQRGFPGEWHRIDMQIYISFPFDMALYGS